MDLTRDELKSFLDEKADHYNRPFFVESDPIQIPHRFSLKEDIEIAGFLAATIAWGNRKTIIGNAHKMIGLMGNSPYDFVMSHRNAELRQLEDFVHRTFNGSDFGTFVRGLRHIYLNHGGPEVVFAAHIYEEKLQKAIHEFRKLFFEIEHLPRAQKHLSDPLKNSAAKRVNMWLRWMVRDDRRGVDLGIWKRIPASVLSCPLDVHSGKVARKLGLLQRVQTDGKALAELDKNLRILNPYDPARYDFALFGLGIFEDI